MFKIRDFSRFTRVSVKMLRHYDQLGLLPPAFVDPATGYRYYTADQVPRLNRIIALKDLGFSLDQVAALLADDLPLDQLRTMLRLRHAEIAQRLLQEQQRLVQVEARLRQVEQAAQPLPYDVVLRSVPPQLVASKRSTIFNLEPIARIFDEVEAYVARYQARSASSPLMMFHDQEYREADLDVEIVVPLRGQIPESATIKVRELPGTERMACVVYTGGYERMAEVLQTLLRWVAANGYAVAGPLREVYLRFSADNPAELGLPPAFLIDEPGLFVTEIQVPVEQESEQGGARGGPAAP